MKSVGEELAGAGGITIDVIAVLSEDVVALAEAIAGTKTAVDDDTDSAIVFLGNRQLVVAVATQGETTTAIEVDVETTIRVVTHQRVVDRPQNVEGEGHVTVIVITIATLHGSPETGEAKADAPVEGVVELLLQEDVHTSIGSLTPATEVATSVHVGLIVEVDGGANRPIAPEAVVRILGLTGVLSKGVHRSHHQGHHNAKLD